VKGFWKRGSGGGELEARLREERPEAPAHLIQDVTRMVEARPRRAPRVASRLAFAAALTIFVLGGFASAGGVAYASESAGQAVDTIKQVFASAPLVRQSTAAADQYQEDDVAEEEAVVVAPEEQAPADVLFDEQELETLPFTGLALLPAAVLGLAFLVLGIFLRRRENSDE
jgi:type VI protein secretion system component VasF